MKHLLNGLYLITDRNLIDPGHFSEVVDSALSGGGKILQLRHKDSSATEVIRIGRNLLEITGKHNVPLIVNDSPEIAVEIGADGVHLGEGDADIGYARSLLGKDAIIGVSCYNRIERGLEAAKAGADYLAFGTPYSTPTKPGREPTSFETLREAKRRIREIPVFAIGGIDTGNARDVLDTGVDGIAVITSVFGSDDPGKAAEMLASLFDN